MELTPDLARRRSLLVAAVAVLLLAGCFPAVASFSKPGVSEEEYERDRYVCVRESRVRNLAGGEEATMLHGERQHPDRLTMPSHESDASDLRLIMVALWGKRLCITCLSPETGVPTPQIEATITTLAAVVAIRESVAGCERCSESTNVFALT